MKANVSDLCPCGSRKAYKRCCGNIQSRWSANIDTIACEASLDARIAKIFDATLVFISQTNWRGACHGIAAIQYVIFSELGFEPKLYAGITETGIWTTGHSWIEMEGKVYDAACYFSVEDTPRRPPVFHGIELNTMKPTTTAYGIAVPPVFSEDVQAVLDAGTTVPGILNGEFTLMRGAHLWHVLDNICMLAGIDSVLKVVGDNIDANALIKKYKNTRWELRDQIPVDWELKDMIPVG